MKLEVRKYPIYGLSIETGEIETFTQPKEALQFFLGTEPQQTPTKLPLAKKKSVINEQKIELETPLLSIGEQNGKNV